jgi:hypothetical protein
VVGKAITEKINTNRKFKKKIIQEGVAEKNTSHEHARIKKQGHQANLK